MSKNEMVFDELTKEIRWFESHMSYFTDARCAHHAIDRLKAKREWIMGKLERDENTLEGGVDYVQPDDTSCWITAGSASVHLTSGSEGVGVTIYPKGAECEDSVAETWATWAELAYEDN